MNQRANLIKARGLITYSSELNVPEGALVKATNVNIDENAVITPRRGFNDYGGEIGVASDRIKQIMQYKSSLLRHYNGTIDYESSENTFTSFSGQYNELIEGLRLKYKEVNGNLYFTTSSGIKKLSAKNSAGLSSAEITNAGGIKAVDLEAKVLPTVGGFLPAQSKVAYRILFGTKDKNNNLILGSPSARFVLENTSQDSSIKEESSVEFTGVPNDSDYFILSTSAIDYVYWFNVTGFGEPPVTESDAVGATFFQVNLQGATEDNSSGNAKRAALTANTILGTISDFDVVIDANASKLNITSKEEGDIPNAKEGSLLSEVTVTTNLNGTITEGTTANAEINFTLPQDLTTDYFYQVYRTANITATEGLSLNDIDPGDDMNISYEAPVTDADITSGFISVIDNTPESFRASGAILYTSPNSGEGILQSNEPPPIAHDIELFNNSTFYANTKSRHRLQINLLSVDDFISETSQFIVSNEDVVRKYTFVGSPEQFNITTDSASNTVNGSSIIMNSANDERKYAVYFDKSGTDYKPEFIDFTTNTLTITGHPFKDDETVTYNDIKHYIVNSTVNTIQLSETEGGSAITLDISLYTVIRKSDSYVAIPETVDVVNKIITVTGHTLVDNDEVTMENLTFYAINSDTNTFQLVDQEVKELDKTKFVATKSGTEFETFPDQIDFTDSKTYGANTIDCTEITSSGHSLLDEDEVTINDETYYIMDRTATTYRVSATKNEVPPEEYTIVRGSDDYTVIPELVTFSTSLFTFTAHGFSNGDEVVMNKKTFYIRDKTVNTFKLTDTSGGAVYELNNNNYKIELKSNPTTFAVPEELAFPTNNIKATGHPFSNLNEDIVTLNGFDYVVNYIDANNFSLAYIPVELDDAPFTIKRLSDDYTAAPEIVDFDTNIITTSAHSFSNEDKVVMDNFTFYIANSDTNTTQLSEVETSKLEKSDFFTSFLTEQPSVENALYVRVNLSQYDDTPAGTVEAISDAFITNIDFIAETNSTDGAIAVGDVRFTNSNNGDAEDVTFGPTLPTGAWSIGAIINGTGESFDTTEGGDVLLSGLLSVSQSIDETSRSLVKAINRDSLSPVNAYYLSGADDLPGIILIENKSLEDVPFFLGVNDEVMSTEFTPEMPVQAPIDSVTFSDGINTPAKITDNIDHNLNTGDEIYLYSPDTIPSVIGKYEITVLSPTEFTVPVNIITEDPALSANAFYMTVEAESDNLESPNRLYFSKLNQPEAVPIVNYIDIGPKDEPIERIIALMDNLVVFKTDGVYLVYGSSAPNFSARLLDNSVNILAPDSAVVLNNQIYCLTTQGVSTVSNSVQIISRPIENLINDVINARYDYKYKVFGIAYENDRAYNIFLPTTVEDQIATQSYRFNTFERSWTRWDVPATSGLVKDSDGKLYIGDGTRNYLLQERKNGDRKDYSDRNFSLTIDDDRVDETVIELSSVADVTIGDVIVQEQTISMNFYNRFLRKLDLDGGLEGPDLGATTYEAKYEAIPGNNIASKLTALNIDLEIDDDSGIVTTRIYSSDYFTMQEQFNELIAELNSSLSDTTHKNYRESEGTIPFESIVISKNNIDNEVTVAQARNYMSGPIECYKGYGCEIQWSPQAFGDPSALKQMREGTILFDQNNFYSASVSYSSDVSADFTTIDFNGKGVGYWGDQHFGNGGFYWGGDGNDIPFRTIIPVEKQRGRYLNVKFNHINAREYFRIIGITAVVRAISSRGYR
jgi:hypothetical protein